MDSKRLRDLREAYGSIYEPEVELTEEQVWEEVEYWVSSLLEEGYDLSDYTWEEMFESYLEEKEGIFNNDITRGISRAAGGVGNYARNLFNRPALTSTSSAKPNPAAAKPERQGPYVPERLKKAPTDSRLDSPIAGKGPKDNQVGSPVKPIVTSTSASQQRQGGSGGGTSTIPAARPAAAPTASRPAPTAAPAKPSGGQTGDKAKDMATWAASNKGLAAASAERARTRGTSQSDNPLMKGMPGKRPMTPSVQSPTLAKDLGTGGGNQSLLNNPNASKAATPPPAAPTPARNGFGVSAAPIVAKSSALSATAPSTPGTNKPKTPIPLKSSYEWGSTSKLVDGIADAYSSIYEAKKVDQDKDGDNDFADVRIARLIASGVSKEEAIRRVRDKSYNEEVEIDEATRMRKELGKEGETATRKELARRSNAYQRSGSVDRTIAAAERGAKNPYVARGKNETEAEHNKRKQEKSQTLTRLASNRRGSVRDKPRAGLRGYAAKVEGSDRDLQSARSSARSAGTLTPAEKKGLGEDFELWVNGLVEEGYDLSDYTWDEMAEIYEETELEKKKAKEAAIAARRARVAELQSQGRVMTSTKRTRGAAAQRKEEKRAEALERAANAILRQTTGSSGKVSDKPMGSQAPAPKEEAPEANRRLKTGLRRDTLGTAADDALKGKK